MRRLDGHHSAWEFPKVQHSSGPGGKIRDSISDIGPGGVASALSKIQRAITKPLNPGRQVHFDHFSHGINVVISWFLERISIPTIPWCLTCNTNWQGSSLI